MTSFVSAFGCNTIKKPTVFTRVSAFNDWIKEVSGVGRPRAGLGEAQILRRGWKDPRRSGAEGPSDTVQRVLGMFSATVWPQQLQWLLDGALNYG